MKTHFLGWDIGGAHLKAACLNTTGEILQVLQQPCPLWKGLPYLQQAIQSILLRMPRQDYRHIVTMTGELADCFSSREQGVAAILQTMAAELPDSEIVVFAGNKGFLPLDQVQSHHTLFIASANWLASAQLAAKHWQHGLFVDIGSTTTDILLLENFAVQTQGQTDFHRLISGELVYTGIIRTSVMSVAQQAEFMDQTMGLMAEHFATMADVYRLIGDLKPAHDQSETADGMEKTPQASARRLSRLTGYEFSEQDWPIWLSFALEIKRQQKQRILNACLQQLSRRSHSTNQLGLIGAGVGRFLAREIAQELGLVYHDFNDLFPRATTAGEIDAADCAPAAAVAYLAACLG